MVEMIVDSIRMDIHGTARMVVLREPDTDRILPIIIGPAEAEAIYIRLQKAEVPRPLTHDLLVNAIAALNGEIHSRAHQRSGRRDLLRPHCLGR